MRQARKKTNRTTANVSEVFFRKPKATMQSRIEEAVQMCDPVTTHLWQQDRPHLEQLGSFGPQVACKPRLPICPQR